jgi:hypothetical protein
MSKKPAFTRYGGRFEPASQNVAARRPAMTFSETRWWGLSPLKNGGSHPI